MSNTQPAQATQATQSWTAEEFHQLLKELQQQKTIDEIAEIHQRTSEEIRSRVQDFIADSYYNEDISVEEISNYTGVDMETIEDILKGRKKTVYTNLKVKEITEANEFWHLFDELDDDKSGFIYNRNTILDAFRNGHLYGIEVEETDEMYRRGARGDPLLCRGSMYLLPSFCIKYGSTVDILWTHTRARGNGFATKLVRELGIECVRHPLQGSIGFWKKVGLL